MSADVEEFTELIDAEVPRVDLVDKPANGRGGFLLMKAGGPLMSADDVRALLEKSDYDTADRDRMADSGAAMDDGSYPIANRADLTNAIHAVGRGGTDHNAIRRHIITRAKALGASGEIPDNWNADGSLKTQVTKETEMPDDVVVDEVTPDVTTILAAPDGPTLGAEYDPGSPAWEAVDAATAAKWTDVIARAKSAVETMTERELAEAANGHPEDAAEDAAEAAKLVEAIANLDAAIGVLAPHAVTEAAEAREGEAAMVGKTAEEGDSQVATTQEEPMPETVTKAEVEPQVDAAPVAKDAPASDTTTEADATADVEKATVTAVYDAAGRLVGVVDPRQITTVAQPTGEPGPDEAEPEAEKAAEAPADGEPTGPVDLTPAPPAEVGVPANRVEEDEDKLMKAAEAETLLKSIADSVVKRAIDAYSASQQEVIAKQAADLEKLTETIGVLKAQITALEEQPAAPKVFSNGAVPPAHMLRGQDAGSPAIDAAQIAELRKGLYASDGANAPTQNEIAGKLNAAAIKMLHDIHASQSA